MALHTLFSGSGRGRRHHTEMLNKSAIVLLVACWEAFVEDVVQNGFDALLDQAIEPAGMPEGVLAAIGQRYQQDKTPVQLWEFAGSGWKTVLQDYRKKVIRDFNNPHTENVDRLAMKLLGLRELSAKWYWSGRSASSSADALNELVRLRNRIAHRVQATSFVTKRQVTDGVDLVQRLAAVSSNGVRARVYSMCKHSPWPRARFASS